MYEIDPKNTHLAKEFKTQPYGRHSPELQTLLNLLRREPLKGKFVVFCSKPGKEWMLARLGGIRGEPVRLLEDQVFSTLEEAEWAVFKLRWKKHTGHDLDIP